MSDLMLFDNTRLQAYRECERKFYFRHVRHWVPDGSAPALTFGGAWHSAMDVVWQEINKNKNIPTQELTVLAFTAWQTYWTSKGLPSLDDFRAMDLETIKWWQPRTPLVAFEMLLEYIERRRSFIASCDLLAVEQPFAVRISPDGLGLSGTPVLYIGKLDKVVRQPDGNIYVIEHKTSTAYKKDGPFRSDFMDSFSPNSQIDGYAHAVHMLYGEDAKAVWVDAALVHKDVHDGFRFIPVDRQLAQLDSWLWNTHVRIEAIGVDFSRLHKARLLDVETEPASLPYLPAFPQKTEACSSYGGCPYTPLCKAWANPDMHDAPPAGYKLEKWDPLESLHLTEPELLKLAKGED